MIGLIAIGLASGCARKAPPAPVRPPLALRCPPTVLWPSDGRHPQGLRVVNEGERPVVVWADRCLGWTWLGEVNGGRERLFRLPDGLVAWSGQLRFHVLPDNRLDDHFAALLPIDTVRVLRLTVPAQIESPCPEQVYVDGELRVGGLRGIPAERIAALDVEYVPVDRERSCPRIHVKLR